MGVVLKRVHQLRQKGMEPLAAKPITGFPQRHQRLNHLGPVTAAVLAAEACLPLLELLVQPAEQRFAVIAGKGLKFIQQQLFPCTAQAPVTGCCCADRQRNQLSFLERASSAWPHALRVSPR
jgi:hypothetical protein